MPPVEENGMANHHTILLVEDDRLLQDVLSRRFEALGFRVATVEDGIECLEWLSAHRVDLVLMDVSMPRMNGIECLFEIRKRYSYDSLPVIIVSAMMDSDDVIAGLEAGANDYVVKPINFRVLHARIHTCLRMKMTVTLLVEAERQRVMVEALNRSAKKLGAPLGEVIDRLEELMNKTLADQDVQRDLHQTVACIEEMIEVIEKIKEAGQSTDLPYAQRLQMIQDSSAEAS